MRRSKRLVIWILSHNMSVVQLTLPECTLQLLLVDGSFPSSPTHRSMLGRMRSYFSLGWRFPSEVCHTSVYLYTLKLVPKFEFWSAFSVAALLPCWMTSVTKLKLMQLFCTMTNAQNPVGPVTNSLCSAGLNSVFLRLLVFYLSVLNICIMSVFYISTLIRHWENRSNANF